MTRTVLQNTAWPSFHSPVLKTKAGTRYLRGPGAVLIGQTETNLDNLEPFLRDFGFEGYLNDPTPLTSGEALDKFAGQVCYLALGEKRTMNADAGRYFSNIKSQAHGSVLEHSTATVLIYGVSRSLTHEHVRHRTGTAFSQLSQRYVDGEVLRFVERSEYQRDSMLHAAFENYIDAAAEQYKWRADRLLELQVAGDIQLSGERKTELRKAVNQAARSCLPNETETIMVFSGNTRAWRHIFEMRASEHAEPEIRRLIFTCFEMLNQIWPTLLEDYETVELKDGTQAVQTKYRKV